MNAAEDVSPIDPGISARVFHALSDPTRLAILQCLCDGERRVSDIVDRVGSSQPNVSNHLSCLKGCGMVVDRPGARRQVFYSIAHPEVLDLLAAADAFLAQSRWPFETHPNQIMGQPRRS